LARPLKDGIDYWPLDVGLFRDKKFKLIKAEFGIKGVYIALELINAVYETNGYYKAWDNDDCFLMSEGVGDGCSPKLVSEVLNGCLRRSIFDMGVFEMFGVITSAGIQRRYLRIVSTNRLDIPIFKEYWLLEKNEIPASVYQKIAFNSVFHMENPVKSMENPVKSMENPQSKVKKNKVKENKTYIVPEAIQSEWDAFIDMRKAIKKPMTEKAMELAIKKLNELAPNDFEKQRQILNQSVFNGWQGLFPLKKSTDERSELSDGCADWRNFKGSRK